MPDYKTGTYIIRASKEWICECCKNPIHVNTLNFARIKEYGESLKRKDGQSYRKKKYYRYHIHCAQTLSDLNDYEKSLIAQTLGPLPRSK